MDLDDAAALAARLLREHGLEDWDFGFDRAKVRAGACRHATRTITLSRHLTGLHGRADVEETLLHEIAHALVGPAHHHDQVWRATAVRIGATGQRCYDPDLPAVPGRWQGRCAAGHVVQRHRRPTAVLVCTRCPSSLGTLPRTLTWSRDGVPVGEEELGPRVRRTMARLRRESARMGR